jgi:hypothetical protein
MASNPIKENEKENVVDTGVRVYRFRVTVLSPLVSGQSSIQHPLLERACLTCQLRVAIQQISVCAKYMNRRSNGNI